ncbi:MAG: FTR1 family protein [Rhodobacteraceae bacterium]|nr:FTR1 family protein [Paracoccaceae bacterium]
MNTGHCIFHRLAVVFIGFFLVVGTALADVPWQNAETIRAETARVTRLLYRPVSTARDADLAAVLATIRSAWNDGLADAYGPDASLVGSEIDALGDAIATNDGEAAARARSLIWTGLLKGAMDHTLAALDAGDATVAAEWLSIREYARASGETATGLAMDGLKAGNLDAAEARRIAEAELLGIYAAELRLSLSRAADDLANGRKVQLAGELGRAKGLFLILADNISARMGPEVAKDVAVRLDRLNAGGDTSALAGVQAALASYAPVALSPDERDRRARLLRRFLGTVEVEYTKGMRDGEIVIPMEYHESVLFRDRAAMIFGDLRPEMTETAPEAAERMAVILKELAGAINQLADPQQVSALTNEALTIIDKTYADAMATSGYEEAVEALPASLDELVLIARSGDWAGAELKRLEAYSWYDPDFEGRLRPREPAMALRLEARFWEGSANDPGLGALLAAKAPITEIAAEVETIKTELLAARAIIETPLSPTGTVVQSVTILLREGLEAVLILAALTGAIAAEGIASRRWRRPVLAGVGMALLASFALWYAAGHLFAISTLQRELLEGTTALLAAAVLIYMTHTIFSHRGGGHMTRMRESLKGGVSTTGIFALAFFVVFREGFETVLFYEAMLADANASYVLIGLLIGTVICAAVAWMIFGMGARLPIKLFFRITGVLLAVLSVVLVGTGIRGLQTAAVISATPVSWFPDVDWLQIYLGLYPVAEALIAQALVAAFFIGGWLLPYLVHQRNPQKS